MTTQLTVGGQRSERHVSRKVWIGELLAGTMDITPGVEPNTFVTARGTANRVNIIGVVISREELPVSSLTIDDGTGQVIVRSFEQKLNNAIGTVVQVIGRPRNYQGNLYVAAEAVATVDPQWAEYRKKELGDVIEREQPAPAQSSAPVKEENKAERIIKVIRELDAGDGALIDQVILLSKIPDAEVIIEQLLMQGDIFELRPGKVKVL
jgi:RPA family protein